MLTSLPVLPPEDERTLCVASHVGLMLVLSACFLQQHGPSCMHTRACRGALSPDWRRALLVVEFAGCAACLHNDFWTSARLSWHLRVYTACVTVQIHLYVVLLLPPAPVREVLASLLHACSVNQPPQQACVCLLCQHPTLAMCVTTQRSIRSLHSLRNLSIQLPTPSHEGAAQQACTSSLQQMDGRPRPCYACG